MNSDKTIYILLSGRMVKTGSTRFPLRPNFLIVNEYGDWSGFRPLSGCEAQIGELEEMAKKMQRADGYYRIVERF